MLQQIYNQHLQDAALFPNDRLALSQEDERNGQLHEADENINRGNKVVAAY